MKELLDQVLAQCAPYIEQGRLASYIPELAKVNPQGFAISVVEPGGAMTCTGDVETAFTMQSIIKPIILLVALMDNGADAVRQLVGVESTGKPFDAFNYSDQALNGEHINPMINTGAIALCSLIKGETYLEKFNKILDMTRKISGNPHIHIDEQVYASEKATGNKNRALAYMLKAYGMISDPVEEVLDCYFRACSIRVSCKDLARIGRIFA